MKKVDSKKIKEIREELDLNIEQFAQLLDVTPRTIQRWDQKGEVTLGKTAGKKNLEHLVEVMNNKVTKKELVKVLKESKVSTSTEGLSLSLVSSVLDTMALIAGASFGIGGMLGNRIIKMLKRVVKETSSNEEE